MCAAIDLTQQVGRSVPIKQHNTQPGKEYRVGKAFGWNKKCPRISEILHP